MTVSTLPGRATSEVTADTARWRPTRAGLLNVWRYYDEELEFAGGRLLLRGANGSGKSKALELLLPFLLDANLRASRLSTFGTAERTMHWNLMGQGATGATRVGYVWVEFGHEQHWFTAGVRLQASTHSTAVQTDYFTTTRRVRHDLALTTDAGTPLTRAELVAALGEHGTRHDNAGDYRTAVRTALFPGMSEQRYEALITALLQLRTPKLSQRLDPALLSTLLSRALPPLGETEVADLAEGFERLDRRREHLIRLDEEADAARRLADRQREYAQRVLRAGAAALIGATSEMDGRTRAVRRGEEQRTEAEDARGAAEERAAELASVRTDAITRLEALRDSPAYQEGVGLEDLRRQSADARARAEAADRAHAGAERTAVGDEEAADAARRHAATVDSVRATRLEETVEAARGAGLDAVLSQVRGGAEHGLLPAAVQSRHHQIGEVRGDLDAWDRAVARRTDREADLEAARAELGQAGTARAAAADRHAAAVGQLADDLEAWLRAARELVAEDPDPAVLVGAVREAAESASEVARLVESAAQPVRRTIDVAEADATRRDDELAVERRRVTAERDRVERDRDVAPVAPPIRTADRAGRPGAPLWRLVAFADTVDALTQAGVEAALEASGLLDAWVDPEGTVVFAGDAFVTELAPAPGPSLLDVLRPEPDTGVPTGRLRRLLAGVAHDDDLDVHPAVVSADGRFRLAALTGSWAKPEPAFIGATARERARRRRLAELVEQLAALDEARAGVAVELDGLRRRREQLAAELADRPDHRDVDAAGAALTHADAAVAAADQAVRRGVALRGEAEAAVGLALRALTARAAEHGLPTEREALDALERAITTFSNVAAGWLAAENDVRHARDATERAGEHAQRSRDAADARAEEAARADEDARRLGTRVETVEQHVGAEYREVLAQIAATREQEAVAGREATEVAGRLRELDGRLGRLTAALESDRARRDESATARDTAAAAFRAVWLLGLPSDAELAETDLAAAGHAGGGTRATLDLARSVAAAAASVPHEPRHLAESLRKVAETVHACRDTLGARADLTLETEDDVQVLRAVLDGRTIGARTLRDAVTAEADRSRREITEAERDLFDTTLTGETRRHLAARIREADALVRSMNERLTGVRTASNVAVRLRWTVSDDVAAGTRAARDLLLRDPAGLSEEARSSLHRFFRDRVDAARADGTAGSWQQQLTEVFDYTRWHQFVVELDRGDGQGWQKLTRKLHGALSGGEKAIALHLPLFAAVAAYYESVPGSPRLILLDEVFVGVDEMNRGQVFALLGALGLDLVLTSDHEWCLYREIDAIAIHQLITGVDDTDDAVTTARWVWNGRELVEA